MNIGAASEASGVSQRIRYYQKIEVVPEPPRRVSYRDYADTDIHRLRFIANARDLGFPIEDIRTLLGLWSDRDRSCAKVKALAKARAAELGSKARALKARQSALVDLVERCHGNDRPPCRLLKVLLNSLIERALTSVPGLIGGAYHRHRFTTNCSVRVTKRWRHRRPECSTGSR
jgi:MerR family copper efflux transcriptional regulator